MSASPRRSSNVLALGDFLGRLNVERPPSGGALLRAPWTSSHKEISASNAGHTTTVAPSSISSEPVILASTNPCRQLFSTKKSTKIAAIHIRFMSPTTSNTEVRAQQHPRHNAPWMTPARKELSAPPEKSCVTMNANGLWHWSRQYRFQLVN